jgi:hypothetical protein
MVVGERGIEINRGPTAADKPRNDLCRFDYGQLQWFGQTDWEEQEGEPFVTSPGTKLQAPTKSGELQPCRPDTAGLNSPSACNVATKA